jgi:hypothetical protein
MSQPREPLIDKCIEMYATYGTPTDIFKRLRAEYGENSLSYGQVKKLRETHRKEILEKRKEISAGIPILDPMERFACLQSLVDGAMEETPIYDRMGNQIGTFVDRKNALAALKLAHEFSHTEGAVTEDDAELIRSIVIETYDDLKKSNPAMSNKELLSKMLDELPESAREYVHELEYVNNN